MVIINHNELLGFFASPTSFPLQDAFDNHFLKMDHSYAPEETSYCNLL